MLLPLSMAAQIRFEKGYFIDEEGQRTECLIKNRGWNNNPASFTYKLSADAPEQERTISNTSEFAIENEVKYVKAEVEMERSTNKTGSLNRGLNVKFAKETHFLKVLVEGNATLYVYEENGLMKFFHKTKDGKIEQLVHVKYMANSTDVREYNQFHSQLDNSVKCEGTTLETLRKLKYETTALTNYFEQLNQCSGLGKASTLETKKSKAKLNVRPVVGFKSMKIDVNPELARARASTSKGDIAYGVELEYVLATNRNKWAFFIEATYNKIEEEIDIPDPGAGTYDERADLKFAAVQIPVGARYYAFLNDDFKIFGNVLLAVNVVSTDSGVTYKGLTGYSFNSFSYNGGLGIGLSYKRFNAEARYYAPQNLMRNIDGEFNKISFTVNYAIF